AERLTTPNPVTLTQPKHTIKGARGITARSFYLIISPESPPTRELPSRQVTQLEKHSAPKTTSQAPPPPTHQIVDAGGLDATCTLGAPALPLSTGEPPWGTPRIPPTAHPARYQKTPDQNQK